MTAVRTFFLNRFYWPNESATAQLLHDVTRHLAARGRCVVVLTCDDSPGGHIPRTEEHTGVRIIRVSRVRLRAGLAQRAFDAARFLAASAWVLVRQCRRGDTVVAMTDPPLLGVVAGFFAGLKHARVVHWAQDIYPEIVIALVDQPFVRHAARLALPLRDASWRGADRCVAISGEIAALMAARGVCARRISIVANWAPRGITALPRDAVDALRSAWGLEGRFVVAYSGNLGRVHDLAAIADLAEHLRTNADIVILIIGSGPGQTRLSEAVAARRLDNVVFLPPQPRAMLNQSLAVADVHLVTLRPDCAGLVFPSKTYGIARAGRAIAFIGPRDCEPARLIAEHGLGIAATRDELPQLADRLRQWSRDGSAADFGRAAAEFGRRLAGVETGCAAWEELLDDL